MILVIASGCASNPVSSDTVENVWKQLLAEREAFEGARGLAVVTVTQGRRQSIDAGFTVGANGNLELSVMSPFGTSLATVFSGDGDVVIVNRSAQTYWEGSLRDLEGLLPLGGIEMEGLGYLMAGLPPYSSGWSVDRVGENALRVSRGELRMLVLPEGIASVEIGNPVMAKAGLDLPSRPPTRVTISDDAGNESAEIAIERMRLTPAEVAGPTELAGYERVQTWLAVLGK